MLGLASAHLLVWTILALTAHPHAAGGQTTGKPPATLGIGRAATPEEIRRLDIDVMPDGRGLPPGKGTVAEGAAVYAAKCQSCHGVNGQGGKFDRLVGREPGLKTIGAYWPYATTLYDYTARSMPFFQPGTLTPNEVYSLVAYLLHLNEIVPETAVMDATTLPKVQMPARDKFVKDDRTGGKVVK
jgi:mono/diheme cytochrome c family protein